MTLNVQIPEVLAAKVALAAKSLGTTPEALVLDAVSQRVDPFASLRERMSLVHERMKELGITEEDAVDDFEMEKHAMRQERRARWPMKNAPSRVVFDCNVFFQALTSPFGPAARLLELAYSRDILLFVSEGALAELREVASRKHLIAKYHLDEDVIDAFIVTIRSFATCLDPVPHVFDFERDPDDAHYVDLAVAARALLIVSRDKDLLSLCDLATPQAQEFKTRFPGLRILTPPEALAFLETQ